MKVTEQIDALEAVAVDSFKFLAVTRIIACMIAMPLLTIIMDFCGIFGGYVAETAISGMSRACTSSAPSRSIDFSDFIPATLKTIVFGFIIGTVVVAISASPRPRAPKASAARPRAASSWRRSASSWAT